MDLMATQELLGHAWTVTRLAAANRGKQRQMFLTNGVEAQRGETSASRFRSNR